MPQLNTCSSGLFNPDDNSDAQSQGGLFNVHAYGGAAGSGDDTAQSMPARDASPGPMPYTQQYAQEHAMRRGVVAGSAQDVPVPNPFGPGPVIPVNPPISFECTKDAQCSHGDQFFCDKKNGHCVPGLWQWRPFLGAAVLTIAVGAVVGAGMGYSSKRARTLAF